MSAADRCRPDGVEAFRHAPPLDRPGGRPTSSPGGVARPPPWDFPEAGSPARSSQTLGLKAPALATRPPTAHRTTASPRLRPPSPAWCWADLSTFILSTIIHRTPALSGSRCCASGLRATRLTTWPQRPRRHGSAPSWGPARPGRCKPARGFPHRRLRVRGHVSADTTLTCPRTQFDDVALVQHAVAVDQSID